MEQLNGSERTIDIEKIKLRDLQPSQFYLSERKVLAVQKWFNPENLTGLGPLPIRLLNGKFVLTDGHTRAWVAYRAGLEIIPLIWDEADLDWDLYQECVDASIERGVCSIADFEGRILSAERYEKEWIGWCSALHRGKK